VLSSRGCFSIIIERRFCHAYTKATKAVHESLWKPGEQPTMLRN